MDSNGHGAKYYPVHEYDKHPPFQYKPLPPNPNPVQPRTLNATETSVTVSGRPFGAPSYQKHNPAPSDTSTVTYHYDGASAIIGAAGGTIDPPKLWPGTFDPSASARIYADPYNTDKIHAVHFPIPDAQHIHGEYDDFNRSSFDSVYVRPPLRRFTVAWFKWHWNVQVSRRRLPRLLYVLTGLLLLVGWLSITLTFANNLKWNEAKNSAGSSINTNAPPSPGSENQIFLFMSGQLNRFDPGLRILNIDWTMFGATGPLKYDDLRATEIPINRWGREVYALFRDTVARPDLGTNITAFQPFRVINPNVKPVGFLGMTEFDTITTDIGLGQRSTSPWKIPEFGYPFDVFRGTITWVAANNGTITDTGRPGSGVFGMRGAILTDTLLNIKVRSNVTATCFIADDGCELIIDFWVERTGLVKFCVIGVFLVNWIVTIASFLVTGEALLLNRTNIVSGTDILAICFSALFALPSVRSLLPGVPGYGCLLDMVGILPNVIIVALCTTFFANSRLRMRMHQHREREGKRQ